VDPQHLQGGSEEEDVVRRGHARFDGAVLARAARRGVTVLAALCGAGAALAAGPAVDEPVPLSITYVSDESSSTGSIAETASARQNGSFGARTAIEELNLNGGFLGGTYALRAFVLANDGAAGDDLRAALRDGSRLVVADLAAPDLLRLADLPEADGAVIVDGRTSDDVLREGECRRNVLHVLPDWSMRADALGQFLARRNWRRWFLLYGTAASDHAYADAVRRAARRVGARLVADREFSVSRDDETENDRREQVPALLIAATRIEADYDVLVVADTTDAFGPQLPFDTARPRPIAGTHGLVPAAWHRGFREFAARAMTLRFMRLAGREMSERDYGSWLAVAVLGEAVVRAGTHDIAAIDAYLRSERLSVPAFKGEGVNFRPWDGQLRQPVALFGPDALISMSPQEGFTHAGHASDALGRDRDESACRFRRRGGETREESGESR